MANDPEQGGGADSIKPASKSTKAGVPPARKNSIIKPSNLHNPPQENNHKPDQNNVRTVNDPPDISTLQLKIITQEKEIARLMQMLQVLAGNEGQNIREAKILELSKRNRDLNLSLERERRCSMKWKYQMNLLKEELLQRHQNESEVAAEKEAEKEAKEIQEWKEKYNQTSAKLLELQAARSMLSAEVTKMQHALQREVGEHIPISKVLEEGGDWKGRSQQICVLKDKISDLKMKLKRLSAEGTPLNPSESFDNAQRRDYEQMGMKLLACREELRITKQKLDGVLARRRVLENELKCAKEKMSMLVGKSDNDDRLITALRLEIEAQKQDQGPVLYGQKVGGPLSLDLVQRQHRLAASFHDLQRHCYQQELQIQAQSELIDYLRAITASQHDEEVMRSEKYGLSNDANRFPTQRKPSEFSLHDPAKMGQPLTQRTSDVSQFDNPETLGEFLTQGRQTDVSEFKDPKTMDQFLADSRPNDFSQFEDDPRALDQYLNESRPSDFSQFDDPEGLGDGLAAQTQP